MKQAERNQMQKSTYYMVLFVWNCGGKTNLWWHKADQCFPGDRGEGEWKIDGKWAHGNLGVESNGSGYKENTLLKFKIIHFEFTVTSQPLKEPI